MPSNGFADHCREIAKRFLVTAVVVDDRLSVSNEQHVHGGLSKPGLAARGVQKTVLQQDSTAVRPVSVIPITRSFANQGLVCGVVSPENEDHDYKDLARAVGRADIVILDWVLHQADRSTALPLLKHILEKDQPGRLRLVALYTVEPDLNEIRNAVVDGLNGLDRSLQTALVSTDGKQINFRGCCVKVYAKPGSSTAEKDAIVTEKDIADKLTADFAEMVRGLLPSLVLSVLTAVRENVFNVLGRFGPDLDPAYLTHRACLPLPADSENHIGEQIASELHGIIEDDILQHCPAGIDAIELWLDDPCRNWPIVFGPGKEMGREDILKMLRLGVEQHRGPLKKQGEDFKLLSGGFSGNSETGRRLDAQFASIMGFRQVLPDAPRVLSMGTVVFSVPSDGDRNCSDITPLDPDSSKANSAGEDSHYLLCIMPKCDSIRITKTSSFLFLPLSDAKRGTLQIVVQTADEEYTPKALVLKPSKWCIIDFEPDGKQKCVLAKQSNSDNHFKFTDVKGRKYKWVGELKAENAQLIAQAIGHRISRVPINKSEWLRRSER